MLTLCKNVVQYEVWQNVAYRKWSISWRYGHFQTEWSTHPPVDVDQAGYLLSRPTRIIYLMRLVAYKQSSAET